MRPEKYIRVQKCLFGVTRWKIVKDVYEKIIGTFNPAISHT